MILIYFVADAAQRSKEYTEMMTVLIKAGYVIYQEQMGEGV